MACPMLSVKRRHLLYSLLRNGITQSKISREHHFHKATVKKAREFLGLPAKDGANISDEKKRLIDSLIARGYTSILRLSMEAKVCKQTIKRRIFDLTPPETRAAIAAYTKGK